MSDEAVRKERLQEIFIRHFPDGVVGVWEFGEEVWDAAIQECAARVRADLPNYSPKGVAAGALEIAADAILALKGEMMSEKILMWMVWRLPRKVVYWSAVRVAAAATQGEYSGQIVSELTALEALKRWR